jgi:hypothetical protein
VDYYIASDQQRLGPFTIEQLAMQGLQPNTFVWREGMPEWAPASTVPELLPLLTVQPFPGQSTGPQQAIAYAIPGSTVVPPFIPGQSNRIAAGVCGILLGQFGVHKFIAGLTTGGVTMLCITLGGFLGGFTTAFGCCPGVILIFGPMVMGIIGLIEGIMYLCCTDEEFYLRYVVQKRQWF